MSDFYKQSIDGRNSEIMRLSVDENSNLCFRMNDELKALFMQVCKGKGTNASSVIKRYVNWCVKHGTIIEDYRSLKSNRPDSGYQGGHDGYRF